MNRKILEQKNMCGICGEAFTDYSDICPTTLIREAWEARGEMTTRTISKPCTSGAMAIKPGSIRKVVQWYLGD